ncbi:hypothetical protein H6G51_17005 [Limnothrix sp. FACHB-708]|nr:hypothetical protein [Limnothrix sp. FACHB-708]MBD2592444.1 hypothetical protein [Limnothrix sp. FACHB-406]
MTVGNQFTGQIHTTIDRTAVTRVFNLVTVLEIETHGVLTLVLLETILEQVSHPLRFKILAEVVDFAEQSF